MTIFKRIARFYAESWQLSIATSTGRKLWIVLALKVAVLLVLFRILFFPDRLEQYEDDAMRAEAVRQSITDVNHK